MLGWDFSVMRFQDADRPGKIPVLASWEAGFTGDEWIYTLVKQGKAVFLGGDGYPLRFKATTATILAALAGGSPKHEGGWVFGEDYVQPPGWASGLKIDREAFSQCPPDEELLIEVWDLS